MDELLEAITDRYFKIDCAVFTPNPSRIDHVKDMYKRYNAQGVIHYSLQFCQPYMVESGPVEAELEKAGIPVLRLETDYSQEDAGQLKTRIEAFRERIAEKVRSAGIDIGSRTVKLAVIEDGELVLTRKALTSHDPLETARDLIHGVDVRHDRGHRLRPPSRQGFPRMHRNKRDQGLCAWGRGPSCHDAGLSSTSEVRTPRPFPSTTRET